MSLDLSATERAYIHLKQDILSGRLGNGAIDIRTLADRLRVSPTPVREALARLLAERLVHLSPHQGYAVMVPSVRRLQDLYELNGALLDFCITVIPSSKLPYSLAASPSDTDYAAGMGRLTLQVAASQPNSEVTDCLASLNDRLEAARRCESTVFPDRMELLMSLIELWNAGELKSLRLRMKALHAACKRHADKLADMLMNS